MGKRSQITAADTSGRSALSAPPAPPRTVHQTDSAKAATPSKAFWESLTMVAALVAESPMLSPATTTAPVVSMVPPIQAPPTMSERSSQSTASGIRIIIGAATTSTSDVT